MNVLRAALNLLPAAVYLVVIAAGMTFVVQRGQGAPWARLALLGLGLMGIGQLCSLTLTGSLLRGVHLPGMGAYTLVGLVGMVADLVGFALLVAAALSGRARGGFLRSGADRSVLPRE